MLHRDNGSRLYEVNLLIRADKELVLMVLLRHERGINLCTMSKYLEIKVSVTSHGGPRCRHLGFE
jgi:hypothetical protein